MSNIAIIPARGGSKRIPQKNIKNFCGKPIIVYSIEATLKSNLFEEVMVSTDDKAIADIAIQYGAKVPFMRSEKTADDYATTADVLKEVLNSYKGINRNFEYGCCIYPTAPFINSSLLHMAFNKLIHQQFDVVFPAVKFAYPIWRSLKLEDDKATMWWPENLNKRSQDLPAAYHDAGQFYWFNTEKFLQKENLFTGNAGALIVDELQVHDIDTLQDWQIAELKFKYLQHNLSDKK